MSSSSQVAESWISSFCALLGHEYFAEVSEDFIEDDFNLTGLQSQVPMYKEALEMILDVEPEDDDDDEEDEEEDEDDDEVLGDEKPAGYRRAGDRRHLRMASDLSMIESSAELLYGLIHQRYITSRPGIQQMAEKYELQHFGMCPRVHCNGCKVLPVGCSDTPGQETVKLFCPSCLDVYTPPNSRFQTVDGAFFGTTFGCLFFMTFPEIDIGVPRTTDNLNDALAATAATAGEQNNNGANNGTNNASNSSSKARTGSLIPVQPALINGMAPHNLAPGLGDGNIYEPRIYGFRVSERARSGPRMKWLRMRPNDLTELDETKRYWEDQRVEASKTEEGDEEDKDMPDVEGGSKVGDRKKAVARRRRAAGSSGGGGVGTNGVGEGG